MRHNQRGSRRRSNDRSAVTSSAYAGRPRGDQDGFRRPAIVVANGKCQHRPSPERRPRRGAWGQVNRGRSACTGGGAGICQQDGDRPVPIEAHSTKMIVGLSLLGLVAARENDALCMVAIVMRAKLSTSVAQGLTRCALDPISEHRKGIRRSWPIRTASVLLSKERPPLAPKLTCPFAVAESLSNIKNIAPSVARRIAF